MGGAGAWGLRGRVMDAEGRIGSAVGEEVRCGKTGQRLFNVAPTLSQSAPACPLAAHRYNLNRTYAMPRERGAMPETVKSQTVVSEV